MLTIRSASADSRLQYAEIAAHLICVVLIAAYVFAYVFLQGVFDGNRFGLDIQGYWHAADRLASGRELYLSTGLTGNEEYRYSPWLAAVFVPLGALPRPLVEIPLVTAGVATVLWLAWPLRRTATGVLLAALIVPQMLEYAWLGNIDPFVLAAAALYGRRAGPILVGVAASLKVAPIAFVVPYLVARQWKRAAIAVLTAVVLWLPALAFDLSLWDSSLTPISPMSISLAAGVAWATMLTFGALLSARRHPTLAAALLSLAMTARLHLYSVGILIIPARDALSPRKAPEAAEG
jgi:hypothetical protein